MRFFMQSRQFLVQCTLFLMVMAALPFSQANAANTIRDMRNTLVVTAGASFSFTTYYKALTYLSYCPGCITQIVVGVEASKACLAVSTRGSGSTSFTLTAPATYGVYKVWGTSSWQNNCTNGMIAAAGGGTIGTILVPPSTTATVGFNTTTTNTTLQATASKPYAILSTSTSFPVTFDYNYAPGGGYCGTCIAQLVIGIQGTNTKQCVFSGVGNRSGHSSLTFTAPATKGVYYVYGSIQYQNNCTNALIAAGTGSGAGVMGILKVN